MKLIRINIMGPMGVGKSTIVKALGHRFNIPVIHEEFENNPYWAEAYEGENPQHLKMQIEFMNQYIENSIMLKDHTDMSVIMDNQFISGYAFVMAQYEVGFINKVDMLTYVRRHHLLCKAFMPVLKTFKHYVVLDKTKSIMERIVARDRKAEQTVSIKFIKSLDKHFKLLVSRMCQHHSLILEIVRMEDLPLGEIPADIISCFPCKKKVFVI